MVDVKALSFLSNWKEIDRMGLNHQQFTVLSNRGQYLPGV